MGDCNSQLWWVSFLCFMDSLRVQVDSPWCNLSQCFVALWQLGPEDLMRPRCVRSEWLGLEDGLVSTNSKDPWVETEPGPKRTTCILHDCLKMGSHF